MEDCGVVCVVGKVTGTSVDDISGVVRVVAFSSPSSAVLKIN